MKHLLCLSNGLHMEIGSLEFLLLMWKLYIKVTNITKIVQIIFNAWFRCFEYVGYLEHYLWVSGYNVWFPSIRPVLESHDENDFLMLSG